MPPQPPQFLAHNPFGLGLGGLAPQFARVMFAVNLSPGLLTSLGQRLEEIVTIHIVEVDVFPAVAPAHHMVDGTGILDSRFSRHTVISARLADGCKNNNAQYDGLTPFPQFSSPSDRILHPERMASFSPGLDRRRASGAADLPRVTSSCSTPTPKELHQTPPATKKKFRSWLSSG